MATLGRAPFTTIDRGNALHWRLELLLVLLAAVLMRWLCFVGFGLGDDLGYLDYVDLILKGTYPPLDPLNQYAYRPLLLYLIAGSVALLGHTDLGVVFSVLLASLITTALVYLFVRILIDQRAAMWCALLFAFEPFNVVNSTTITNDVILSCLVFAAFGMFLLGDRDVPRRRGTLFFATSGLLMTAAFLVKITILPAAASLAAHSIVRLFQNRREVLRSHVGFFASFLMGLAAICTVYYLKKGDFLWQFKSELLYYQAQKPDWYLAGRIDYKSLMWQYPRSLFGRSGYDSFQYREHGFLFWVFLPASIWGWTRTRSAPVRFFVASTFLIFAFFEFYPNYLVPYYLPLVRQERYLEMLLPGAVIIVGLALHQLSRKHRAVAVVILCLMISDFVAEARWRSIQYEDSQRDVRELARYAASTVLASKKPLVLDVPARNSLVFYLRDKAVPLEPVGAQPLSELRDCYIVVGGARSFWWSPGLVFDLQGERIPANWILAYQLPGTRRPWRASNLRVYYATSTSRR